MDEADKAQEIEEMERAAVINKHKVSQYFSTQNTKEAVCCVCCKTLSAVRLKAQPFARHCVKCLTLIEVEK